MSDIPPSLIGQQSLQQALAKSASGKDLYGHAYLLSGMDIVTLGALAMWFRDFLTCASPKEASPCGTCVGCKRNTHGDGVWTYTVARQPDEKAHSVERIRDIRTFVRLRPPTRGRRVVLVDNVDTLRGPAANALLKNLEEPGEELVYILTAQHASAVLPTIRSRTMQVALQPVATATLQEGLVNAGYARSAVEFACVLFPGQAGRAAALLEDQASFDALRTLHNAIADWTSRSAIRRLSLAAASMHVGAETALQRQRAQDMLMLVARDRKLNLAMLRPLLQACLALRTNAQPKLILDAFALQTP